MSHEMKEQPPIGYGFMSYRSKESRLWYSGFILSPSPIYSPLFRSCEVGTLILKGF